jgi:hypothetical protein
MTEDEIEGTKQSWHGDVMSNSLTGPNLKEDRRHRAVKLSNEYKVFARITRVLCVRDENVMEAKSEPIKRQKADPIKWDSKTNLNLVSFFFPFVTFSFLCVSFSPFFLMHLCIIMLERLYVCII